MKSEREAQARQTDAKIQVLLNMFGNYILEVRGVEGKVTEAEMKGFIKVLERAEK